MAFSAVFFVSYLLVTVVFDSFIRLDDLNLAERGQIAQYYLGEYVQENDRPLVAIRLLGIPLFAFVGVLFVVSMVVTYFLSNSITSPIERLGRFATNIGPNNFETNNYEFKDQELADLNTALNQTVAQLAIYDSEQKTFFQNASHELRTPLMSIQSYAEGIVYDVMQPKEAAQTILQEVNRMTELVKDLLYIAQIDNITAAYKKEEIDLVDLLKECANNQQTLANNNKISFTFDFSKTPLPYRCIPELISRAVDNLISNAIRYAATTITLSSHQTENHMEITISDDGKGIEPEVLPHVFERFFKGEGGNTGIGLSIVKSIAEQHGGTVKAQNLKKSGAAFTISLPLPLLHPLNGGSENANASTI